MVGQRQRLAATTSSAACDDLIMAEARSIPAGSGKLLTTPVAGLENYEQMLRELTENQDAIKVYVEVIDRAAASPPCMSAARGPHRRLRPAGRLQLGRAGRPRAARSTGCACRATTARAVRPASSTPTPATGRSGPPGSSRRERRYLPGTLVVETTFTTETGVVRLTRRAGVRAKASAATTSASTPPTSCCARSSASRAAVELVLELAPRPEYGLVRPLLPPSRRTAGARSAVPTGSPSRRASRVDDRRTRRCARRSPSRRASGSASRCAGPRSRSATRRRPPPAAQVAARIADTVEGWRSWEAEHDIYDGPHHELVRFSSRVLKGLTYRPTGAIVAAPDHVAARGPRAASATGTTASRGSATRASRSRRSTSAPARTRPRTSSPS